MKDRVWSLYHHCGLQRAEEAMLNAVTKLGGQTLSSDNRSVTHLAEGLLVLSCVRLFSGQVGSGFQALSKAEAVLNESRGTDDQGFAAKIWSHKAIFHALAGDVLGAENLLRRVEAYARRSPVTIWALLSRASMCRAVLAKTEGREELVASRLADAQEQAAKWNTYFVSEMETLWTCLESLVATSTDGAGVRPYPEPISLIHPSTNTVGMRDAEWLDIYNSEQVFLGRAWSSIAHSQGLWHRSFHCWIGRLEADGKKTVVLQQRGPFKRDYPNYFDISVAGHYHAGEGLEGGIRELREELGIEVYRDALVRVAARTLQERLGNGTTNREFQDIYFLREHDVLTPDSYAPTYPEVAAVLHCPLDDLLALLRGNLRIIECKALRMDNDSAEARVSRRSLTLDDFIPSARFYLIAVLDLLADYLESEGTRSLGRCGPPVELPDGSLWQLLWGRE